MPAATRRAQRRERGGEPRPVVRRSRSARASAGSRCARARRAPRRGARAAARRERERAGQRLAAVRESGVHEVAHRRRPAPGRGGAATTSTESTFGAGWNTVRGTLRGARGPRRRAARARSWRRTSGRPARRRAAPPPRAGPWPPRASRPGQLLDRLQQHRGGHAVGQVRHDLGGRRLERGEVELHRVGQVQAGVGERRERVRERGLERAVDLHHVEVAPRAGPGAPRARRARRRPRAPRRRASSSAARSITPSRLSSIRKFWPSSRFGPHARTARRRRRLAWRGSLTSRAPARRWPRRLARAPRTSTPRSSATWRAVCATFAGSFGLPRTRLGREVGRVGLDEQQLLGHPPGGLLELGGLRVGDVAGERAEVSALDALVEPIGRREAVQDHGRQRLGVLAQHRERVVLRGARVDRHRQPELAPPARAGRRTRAAGPRAARGRGSSRARSRRSPDAAGRRRRARSRSRSAAPKPAASCGWRPTIAITSACSRAAASARSIDGPSIPTVAIRVTPAARARAIELAVGGSQ